MPDENSVRAQRRPDSFVIELSYEDAERLHDAIEYIEERVIGFTPPVLRHIEGALWAADDRPLRLVPDPPESPAALDRPSGEPQPEEWSPTDEEEAAIAELVAWEQSDEGRAAYAAQDRFAAFVDEQMPHERAAFVAWLDDQARRFTAERDDWRRRWREQLRHDFINGA